MTTTRSSKRLRKEEPWQQLYSSLLNLFTKHNIPAISEKAMFDKVNALQVSGHLVMGSYSNAGSLLASLLAGDTHEEDGTMFGAVMMPCA